MESNDPKELYLEEYRGYVIREMMPSSFIAVRVDEPVFYFSAGTVTDKKVLMKWFKKDIDEKLNELEKNSK